MPNEAMKTLAELPRSELEWHEYMPIAQAMARAGDIDGALRVAELYPGNAATARTYIAEALLKAGNPADALRVGLQSLHAEETLHDAARQLAASGDTARITNAVSRADTKDRVALLLGEAEGLLDRIRARRNER